MKQYLAAVILIGALSGEALATAPSLMTYQGRLKESGLPVTGARSIDVKLCDSLTLGTCYSTGAQSISVANGLFRTTFTAPSPVVLDAAAWYVEVNVAGVPFVPRERLASAPYAIYASSAATLIPNPGDSSVFIASSVVITDSGFSVGAATFVVAGGRVGIGTASPATTLEVRGTLTLGDIAHIHAVGSGAPSIGDAGGGAAFCLGATVAGSDTVGRITMGAGSGACSLVFNTAWTGNAPVCFFQNESAATLISASLPSTVFVNFSGAGSGNVISYLCLSY